MKDGFASMMDLLGNFRLVKSGGIPMSERATVIHFFEQQNFTHKDGTKLTARELGVRLAHYDLSSLYALKSAYNDRLERNGKTAALKYWWYITKTV